MPNKENEGTCQCPHCHEAKDTIAREDGTAVIKKHWRDVRGDMEQCPGSGQPVPAGTDELAERRARNARIALQASPASHRDILGIANG